MSHEPLEEQEMVEILEGIARGGADTARIAAIRALRELRGPGSAPSGDEWEAIYGSEGNIVPFKRADGS